MRQNRTRLVSTLGSSIILAITTAASVGLNTDVSAPPRFDGAGYAVLGEALVSGRGYREINEPESPRHNHFPPGYPAALALLWLFTSRSVVAAHVFSTICTIAAVLLAWKWFRTLYLPRLALIMGMALALNWTWGRIGGSIQSEPLYMLCELSTVLIAIRAGRHSGIRTGIMLGVTLAISTLVRQVGGCLGVAVVLDLGLRGHWQTLRSAVLTAGILIVPWVGWLALVNHHSQLGLFTTEGLVHQIVSQALFYLQRLPDQVTGPFVEVGTSSLGASAVAIAANFWAVIASGIMIWGWVQTLRHPRRRLAGMIAFSTLALLLVWPFTEAGRFLIPLVPFLLVGLADGLTHLLAQVGLKRPRDLAIKILLAISVPYAAYSIVAGRAKAQRLMHADIDRACRWISLHPMPSGPVMTLRPGEVFWQTGRLAVEPASADPDAIARLIDRLGVVYLVIDENRYENAGLNPLEQYVERYPDRIALVWSGRHENASVRIFEIQPAK
jgi:hypothetical protein